MKDTKVKSEIVEMLANRLSTHTEGSSDHSEDAASKYSKAQVKRGVDSIINSFIDALLREERIELRGFASFSTRRAQLETARNPRTGDRISVGERVRVRFKAGKQLREAVNQAFMEETD